MEFEILEDKSLDRTSLIDNPTWEFSHSRKPSNLI